MIRERTKKFIRAFRLAARKASAAAIITTLLIFQACTPKELQNLSKADGSFSPAKIRLFSYGISQSLVYKTTVRYKERSFSALTYLNQVNDSAYKLVMLTGFGNTLMEAELSRDKFVVNNVIPDLDRKPLLKLLERDWRLLLHGNFSRDVPLQFSPGPDDDAYVFRKRKFNQVYYYNRKKAELVRIESYQGASRKTEVEVSSYRDGLPENFTVSHPSLKLSMTMTLLQKVTNESID